MSLREQLAYAIALGRPVLLALEGGERLLGIVEALDDRVDEPLDRDDLTPPPPVAKVALLGGLVEHVDVRRILRIDLGRAARRKS